MTPVADVLGVDWQTLVDAIGLGAVYALMAVGIGLVFGVLRLVNFAYGQLIMAGAYALALASEWDWPGWAGIALCFAVVIALSALMERAVFRPLRGQSPAVMLVATFAIAFLLQSIALLWFGPLGKIASSFASLNRPIDVAGVDIRKITIVAIVVAAICLAALVLLLERTRDRAAHARGGDGLPDRAPARRGREPGHRRRRSRLRPAGGGRGGVADRADPARDPRLRAQGTIVVLAGVVVGGMNRLVSATLGGFAIGFAYGLLGGALPTDQSQYLPSFLFGLVILVLLIRPGGLFTRGGQAVQRV